MKYELPDFETLVKLHQSDAKALDQIKKEANEALISSTTGRTQRRLRGLQFQIDMELRLSKSDLDSCIRISQMMHASLGELRSTFQEAFGDEVSLSNAAPTTLEEQGNNEQASAKILPFTPCT
ncbi:MAG: hypothetical protein ACI9CE_003629 [Flavobacterium sp.]|jgi:hypothetical protein